MALLFERSRLEESARIDAVESGDEMAGADEIAEKAGVVEIIGEAPDPALAAQPVAAIPIAGGRRIEMRENVLPEGGDIGPGIGGAEEAVERVIVRQITGGGELQPIEGDMRGIDVDRGDVSGWAVR